MGFIDFIDGIDFIDFMNFTLCGGSWLIVSYESDPPSDPGRTKGLLVTPEDESR
ncbi:hypothetical protein [Streptomyces sp. NPDC054958]